MLKNLNLYFYLIILNALLVNVSFGQKSTYNPDIKIAPSELQADFDLLCRAIHNYHPEPYTYISKEALSEVETELKKQLKDSLTESQFHILVRKYIVAIKCGHTYAKPSDDFYNYVKSRESILPFKPYLEQNKAFIKAIYLDSIDLKLDDEIIKINGKDISEIITKMNAIQQRDGFTISFVDYYTEVLFRTYYLFLYGYEEINTIEYIRNGKKKITQVPSIETSIKAIDELVFDKKPESLKLIEKISWSDFYIDTISQIGYLDIHSFGRKKFKSFYKDVFSEIHDNNIDKLIIDIRDNGGGYFPNGNKLISNFLDEKLVFTFYKPSIKRDKVKGMKMNFFSAATRKLFALIPNKNKIEGRRSYNITYKPAKKKYDGDVCILANGGSFSMSSYVASVMHEKLNIDIYGSEIGGTHSGSNAVLTYNITLPNSGIFVSVPYYHLTHNVEEFEPGYGLKPTVEIDIPKGPQEQDVLLTEVMKALNNRDNLK